MAQQPSGTAEETKASEGGQTSSSGATAAADAGGIFGAFGKRYYEGGFDEKMTRKEAALILGVRESAAAQRIKVIQAVRRSSFTHVFYLKAGKCRVFFVWRPVSVSRLMYRLFALLAVFRVHIQQRGK